MTERELIVQFREARQTKAELDGALKTAAARLAETTARLIEFLESKQAIATAKYEGLGYARIEKPKLYASCEKEDQEKLFDYLKEQGREDLIKPSVHNGTLSTFVAECLAAGIVLPEFINLFFKPTLKLYQ